ncbi:MAG TPA: polysaccharide deacetylase family protein [Chitinivibrionales bacterium]|nr:polysaccharide deacetylase family protein [Chitinivibrionales bacterium]
MARLLTAALLALLLLSCNDPFLPVISPTDAPLVVITFDDADESIYSYSYRLMRQTDTTWAATHFFPNSYLGAQGNVTLDQEREMEAGGWESGGHGSAHINLTSVPPDTAAAMLKASHDFLVQNGLAHESFAWASGEYNDTVKSLALSYFVNIRSAHDYYYLDGVDRTELGYFAVKSGFTTDDITVRIEDAKRLGSPLVIIGFHVIQPDTAPPLPVYWCKESAFRGFLQYLKSQHLRPMTVREAMRILKGS